MEELKNNFITANREYHEGDVFLFRQMFTVQDVTNSKLKITNLGMYKAEKL